jgi:predicted DsbA family dithiol-disulfide isomerase
LRFPVAVRARYHTDPACSASWAAEPRLRRLMVDFGTELEITYVMGGLAREFGDHSKLVMSWLEHSAESGMPVDPRIWSDGAPRSSYPACIAVKAAAEQGRAPEERYLRVLREGFMCGRRKLDAPEALAEAARRAGLDGERFRIDLESHATLEAFGADLEESRAMRFPALHLVPDGEGRDGWVRGDHPYEDWRAAALAAGATPAGDPLPDVAGALRRFGRMATAELEAVCDLPGPRAGAEAWRLASEWRVKRLPVLASELWEQA